MVYVRGASKTAVRVARAEAIMADINATDKELAKAWAVKALKEEILSQARRNRRIQKLEREQAAVARLTREQEARHAEEAAGRTLRWADLYATKPAPVIVPGGATGDIEALAAEAHDYDPKKRHPKYRTAA